MSENIFTSGTSGAPATAEIQRLIGAGASLHRADETVQPSDHDALQTLLLSAPGRSIRVNPAALPAETWISYDQFSHLMGPRAVQRSSFEKYSREGRTIPGRRIGPKSHMVFRAGDVAQMLIERATALGGAN